MTLASILENSSHVAILDQSLAAAEEADKVTEGTLNGKPVILTRSPLPHTDNILEQHSTNSDEGRALVAAAFAQPENFENGDTTDNAIDEQLQSLSMSSSLDAISETQTPLKDNAFKAKKAPSSTRRPSIQPQLSRAAMLRMGINPTPKRTSSRESLSSSVSKENEQRIIQTPKSLSTPKIQVRQSRASHLRRGSEAGEDTPARRRTSSTPVDFTNTPGHRRSSLMVDVASIKQPAITPRQTRASRLRAGSEANDSSRPPSSVSRRSSTDTFANTPGHKRTMSIPVKSINTPSIAARENRSSALRAKRMSVDMRDTPQKPAFNLSTHVVKEKFVDFDKKKVKAIRRDSGIY